MSWPQWPKLPTLEFPPRELPVFLHPLRLIPHYKHRIGGALNTFLEQDDERLFGPVEQVVTALVVLGLALKSSSQHSLQPVPGSAPALPTISHSIFNDTLSSSGLSPSAIIPPISAVPNVIRSRTGSSMLDHLLTAFHWLRAHLDMTVVLAILLALNALIFLVPRDTKVRMKASWDIFCPPWQDRAIPSSAGAASPESQPKTSSSNPRSSSHRDDPASSSASQDQRTRETQGPRAPSRKATDAAESTLPSSATARSKGKERMVGERPAETASTTALAMPLASNFNVASESLEAKDRRNKLAKEIDRMKREMSTLRADSHISEPEKAKGLQAMEAKRQKLKAMMALEQPSTPRSDTLTTSDSVRSALPASVDPQSEQEQLKNLRMKIAAAQADTSLSEADRAITLQRYETLKQQLKGKGKAEPTPMSASARAPAAVDLQTSASRALDTTHRGAKPANELSPEDRKQLEKVKAKMTKTSADPSLSDSVKAAMLAELDKKRHHLKRKAGAALLAAAVSVATSASTKPSSPLPTPTLAPVPALSTSDAAQRKQLELLKGRMAAIKADQTLTDVERTSKLLELNKQRQKLKIKPATSDPLAVPTSAPTPQSPPSASKPTSSPISATVPLVVTTSTAPENALMVGETSQLKSVLKKSKKKPRQKKNIHHNYFITMRGWRPALVPFPHGLHPKPQAPRHTLWWDNLPKDADHVMATPKIAKAPEELRPGDESGVGQKGDTAVSDATADGAKSVLAKVDEKLPPVTSGKAEDRKSKDDKLRPSPADLAAKDTQAAKAKEKMAEAEKLKAAEKAKATKMSSRAPASGQERPHPETALPSVDPRVQKATWVTQGLLCILLFFVHEQFAFVVLGFFAWNYVQDEQTRVTAALAATSIESKRRTDPRDGSPRSSALVSSPPADRTWGTSAAPSPLISTDPTKVATSARSKPGAAIPSAALSRSPDETRELKPAPMARIDIVPPSPLAALDASARVPPIDPHPDPHPRMLVGSGSNTKARHRTTNADVPPSPSSSSVSVKPTSSDTRAKTTVSEQIPGPSAVPGPSSPKALQSEAQKMPHRPSVSDDLSRHTRPAKMHPALIEKLSKMPPDLRAKYELQFAEAQSKKQAASTSEKKVGTAGESALSVARSRPAKPSSPSVKVGKVADNAGKERCAPNGKSGTAMTNDNGGPEITTTELTELGIAEAPEKRERVDALRPSAKRPKVQSLAQQTPTAPESGDAISTSRSLLPETASAQSAETAHKASEKAKAARREERMRTVADQRSTTRGGPIPVSVTGTPPDATGWGNKDRRQAQDGERPQSVTISQGDRGLEAQTRARFESEARQTKSIETDSMPDMGGLLVQIDNALNALTEEDLTPRATKQGFQVDPSSFTGETDRNLADEKLKDERRSRLLSRSIKPEPVVVESRPAAAAEVDLSPVSVYSQMTEVELERGSSPKAADRQAEDVVSARQALAGRVAVAPRCRPNRSSSVGSFGEIHFDGGTDEIPDPPQTAPLFVKARRGSRDRSQRPLSGPQEAEKSDVRRTLGVRARENSEHLTSVTAKNSLSDIPAMKRPKPPVRDREKRTVGGEIREREGGKDVSRTIAKLERQDMESKPQSERIAAGGRLEALPRQGDETSREKRMDEKEEMERLRIRRRRKEEENAGKKREEKAGTPRLRLEDLTPEQVEQMQREREKRSMRKAREAKEERGEGSSGLTPEEKAEIPLSP